MSALTPRQELQRMEWASKHVLRMGPAGRRWLVQWMLAKFPEVREFGR